TKNAGETKGRKKTDEKHRENQHSSGSVYRGVKGAVTLAMRDSSTALRSVRKDNGLRVRSFVLRHWFVIRHSSFVIFGIMFTSRHVKQSRLLLRHARKYLRYKD